jgi:Carbohydrate esterase, sialic acid-specific acetylesterase
MTRLLDCLSRRAIHLSLLALSIAACGVQEHEQPAETKVNTRPKIAPPPPSTGGMTAGPPATSAGAGAGGTSSMSGGGPSTLGGFGPTAGGTLAAGGGGAGGIPSAGGTGGSGGLGASGAPVVGGAAPATGGSSGILVDINGTMLPKEDVIGFIHIGHSNMAGRTSRPSSESAYFFEDIDLHAWMFKDGRWDPALEPTAGDAENTQFGRVLGGPGTALVKQAVVLAPNKYFVSLGWGRGSAYCSQFLPGGLYYDQMIAAPKALKGKITFAGIIVMLGITERHGTSGDISQFPQCINQLVTAIRNDVGEPNLPLLMNDYEMESTGAELDPNGEFGQAIIPQIHQVPNVVSNAALIPTDGVEMEDNHHFNLTGYRTWTGRILSIMREKGWFPWAQ